MAPLGSSAPLRVLPHSGYAAMPWRNGQGTTLEVARAPVGDDAFRWRLSLATVATTGPFSRFPRYERVVVLVDGPGFTLSVAERGDTTLVGRGASVRFPGDLDTHCTLLAGPCTDFSLMVRRPASILTSECGPVPRVCEVGYEDGERGAVFCLVGRIVVERDAPQDIATLHPELAQHDTLLVTAPCRVRLRAAAGEAASALWLRWTDPGD